MVTARFVSRPTLPATVVLVVGAAVAVGAVLDGDVVVVEGAVDTPAAEGALDPQPVSANKSTTAQRLWTDDIRSRIPRSIPTRAASLNVL
jgi:Cu/Ag efflux pump CusA